MSAAAKYAYLHGRVSVLASRLFPEGTFRALAEDNADNHALLQHMGLERFLPDEEGGVAESSAQGPALEQELIHQLLADVKVLVRPTGGAARDLLVHWVRRYELGNLKTIVRGRMLGRTPAWIRDELLDVGPFSTLPVEDLLQSEDAPEMLRRLEQTPYSEIARQARIAFEARNELFTLDAIIDKHYYVGLNARARTLPASDQQYLQSLLGAIVDRVNLLWLLRYRFVYNLAPAHAYYLLVPAGAHLVGDVLRALVQMGSVEEVIRTLPAALLPVVDGVTTVPEVEDRMACEVARRAWAVLNRATFSVARAFAYLVLREYQLRRMHVILRGKQLRLGKELIAETAWLGCPRSVGHV